MLHNLITSICQNNALLLEKRQQPGLMLAIPNDIPSVSYTQICKKKRLLNPATGRYVTVWISTSGLRTLKKWGREGKVYNLRELSKKLK